MYTYTTLRGRVIDVTQMTEEHRTYLDQVVERWRAGAPFDEFYFELVGGASNPLVGPDRYIRAEIADEPLWIVLRDIEDRVGLAQGRYRAEATQLVDIDPTMDELVPVAEAATRKGVTANGLYKAISRGDVIAYEIEGIRKVSVRSLERWDVVTGRQRGGRSRREATT